MSDFETVYGEVVELGRTTGRGPISSQMEPLLRRLYDSLTGESISVWEVRAAVEEVLRFLITPKGRTNANCWAVDLFMMEDWGPEQRELCIGVELDDVLSDMAGALHDTICCPEIAERFDSTPEQLLQRIESII